MSRIKDTYRYLVFTATETFITAGMLIKVVAVVKKKFSLYKTSCEYILIKDIVKGPLLEIQLDLLYIDTKKIQPLFFFCLSCCENAL